MDYITITFVKLFSEKLRAWVGVLRDRRILKFKSKASAQGFLKVYITYIFGTYICVRLSPSSLEQFGLVLSLELLTVSNSTSLRLGER